MRALSLFILLALPIAYSHAQKTRSCKGNPKLVAECFIVHGRATVGNGTPQMRIWRIGTHRVFGIVPPENEIIPDNLGEALVTGDVTSNEVYGDFEVCPFTKSKAKHMQMVCVESASHLVVK